MAQGTAAPWRAPALVAGALLCAAPGTAPHAAAAGPPAAPHATADEAKTVARSRAAMLAYFRDDPFSPLRAFRRYDFPPGAIVATPYPGARSAEVGPTAVVGSAPEAEVRLEGPGVEPRHLRLTVMAPGSADGPSRFRLERLARGGDVRVSGEPWAEAADDTRIVPEETRIEVGPYALRPYVQADAGILILFDSRRTAGAAFVPPAWFEIDAAWVFHARLERDPKPVPTSMQTSLGRTKDYLRIGSFTLDAPGRRGLRVIAYQPTFVANAASRLSILFTDATSGRETYGAGRYLDLEPPVDGVYTLDFNRAYNPLCAYTGVYNCPIPPRENALQVEVRAGERTWPGHAASGHAAR